MLAVVLFAFAVAELTLLTDPGLVGWPARQSCPRILNRRQREAPTLTPAKVGRLGHAYPPPSLLPAPFFPTSLCTRPPSFLILSDPNFLFFPPLTVSCGLWELSSPTRNQTWAMKASSSKSERRTVMSDSLQPEG